MSRWVNFLTRQRRWINYNAFHFQVKEPSENAIKHLPRTKCARGKIDAMEGGEKKSSLKVEDRDKIIIKIQLSETNFVTTTEQEGQQHNCLCRVAPNGEIFHSAFHSRWADSFVSKSFLLNGTFCFVFCFLFMFVWAIISYISVSIMGKIRFLLHTAKHSLFNTCKKRQLSPTA